MLNGERIRLLYGSPWSTLARLVTEFCLAVFMNVHRGHGPGEAVFRSMLALSAVEAGLILDTFVWARVLPGDWISYRVTRSALSGRVFRGARRLRQWTGVRWSDVKRVVESADGVDVLTKRGARLRIPACCFDDFVTREAVLDYCDRHCEVDRWAA